MLFHVCLHCNFAGQHSLDFFGTAATQSSLLLSLLSTCIFRCPQVPFHRAALQPGKSQPVLYSWITFSHIQDLIFVLVEIYMVFNDLRIKI